MNRLVFIFVMLISLILCCSKWGVMGPEIPIGDTELIKVGKIEISRYVKKLIYSEPYLLAIENSEIFLINVSDPSKPVVEDSVVIAYAYSSNIVFGGGKIYLLPLYEGETLIIYNLLTKPAEIDTLIFDIVYYQILFSKGNVFLTRPNGFDVINEESMTITFSYSLPDSLTACYSKMFVDNKYLYYLVNCETCLVFSHINPNSIEFIQECGGNYSGPVFYIAAREFYLLDASDGSLWFLNMLTGNTVIYQIPCYDNTDYIWDSDFVFSTTEWVYTSNILMFGPPYLQRKQVLNEIQIEGEIRGLTSTTDYLFFHSYDYRDGESNLLIYEIVRYERPWRN